jgi:hypothetical protein
MLFVNCTGKTIKFLLLISLFSLGSYAFGASYYVSNGGNDNAAGTQGSPWARCPGLIGWSGSATLNPGDIVYFDSAGAWSGSGDVVLVLTGGVTYDGRAWGTGTRAEIRASGYIGSSRAIIGVNSDHPTIPTVARGFDVDAAGGSCPGIAMPYSGYWEDLTGATKRIEDCIVHDCGPSGYSYGIIITNESGYTTSNVEIINCVVYNTLRTCISLYPGNTTNASSLINVLVRGCEAYNAGLDSGSAGCGIALKNHIINATIEFNYVHDTPGGIGIITHSATWVGPENTKIRYNTIKNNRVGFIMWEAGPRDIMIYGNMILQNDDASIALDTSTTADDTLALRIYNNVFYQNCENGRPYEIYFHNARTFRILEFVNNIVYTRPGIRVLLCDDAGSITRHSNNIYYNPGGGTLLNMDGLLHDSGTINSWEPSAYTSRPGFKDTSNLPGGFKGTYGVDMEPDRDGLMIEYGDAMGNGADLGVSFNGAVNLSGKSGSIVRPAGKNWDIGVYESLTGGDIPFPEEVHSVYPNPCRLKDNGKITFFGGGQVLSEVKIYTISGKLVKKLEIGAGQSEADWDLVNKKGKNIKSGIYVYKITYEGGSKKTGKILVTK